MARIAATSGHGPAISVRLPAIAPNSAMRGKVRMPAKIEPRISRFRSRSRPIRNPSRVAMSRVQITPAGPGGSVSSIASYATTSRLARRPNSDYSPGSAGRTLFSRGWLGLLRLALWLLGSLGWRRLDLDPVAAALPDKQVGAQEDEQQREPDAGEHAWAADPYEQAQPGQHRRGVDGPARGHRLNPVDHQETRPQAHQEEAVPAPLALQQEAQGGARRDRPGDQVAVMVVLAVGVEESGRDQRNPHPAEPHPQLAQQAQRADGEEDCTEQAGAAHWRTPRPLRGIAPGRVGVPVFEPFKHEPDTSSV